jgi:hypothetical protein
MMAGQDDPMPLQGEGDYIGARKYQKEQAEFAKSGKVDKAAKEAEAALDGPEADDLEAARKSTGKGEIPRKPA